MSPTKQRHPKLPKELPTFIVKASWDATSLKIKVVARNEDEAIEKAWMRVSKMEGGMSCLGVKVLEIR